MSPASRSKSKDKRAAAGKEPLKASAKPTPNVNTGGGTPTSGYNPLLGTFHTLETAPLSSAPPLHINGRFRNIDETDDHSGNSASMGVEYDSVSNNGSWSGESEDQKDKTTQPTSRQETIPGADSDKREKIRQKNEKKHQRQKERRAQELHERCSGYLMSRKLEALAQQLVAMGFSSERATMALILNEGRVEESVAWLFEGGEETDNNQREQQHNNLDGGGNLKIDISEELAQIADMEIKFKCSKQEVERTIVACEGDLEQAAETLRMQKQEPPKPEETGDPPTLKLSVSSVSQSSNLLKAQQPKPTIATPTVAIQQLQLQQRRDVEKDFNYTKVAVSVPSAEPGSKNLQLLKKIQPNLEWTKQQHQQVAAIPSVEKRWPIAGSNPPTVSSCSLASPLQASPPPSKTETRFVSVGNELKNLQLGSVTMMQRPQSKQMQMPTTSISSSSLSSTPVADWHSNGVETVMKPNGLSHIPTTTATRSFSPTSYGSNSSINNNQFYEQFHYQPQPLQYVSSSSGGVVDHSGHPGTNQGNANGNNGLWNRMVGGNSSPTLAAASSLGLFSGLGSNGPSGPSSPVDWNAGGSMLLHLDYTNIDWSLDRAHQSSSRPSGMWQGFSSSSSMQSSSNNTTSVKPALRPVMSNGNNGVSIASLHHDGVAAGSETSGAGSREWTSPFEEKDLFSLPRQFVSSPSL